MLRLIYRYSSNRKLYDTKNKGYVNLTDIKQMIKEGYNIQVIDKKTNEDITYMTQLKLLFMLESIEYKIDLDELANRLNRCL
ncbi:MAG: hypothetical protein GTN36_02780 [Candidatus Aenigmarchaeota archaeon]|nr:hypothetical protein [Candidatus Aenigmarchaeota archaeon]